MNTISAILDEKTGAASREGTLKANSLIYRQYNEPVRLVGRVNVLIITFYIWSVAIV